MCRGERGDLHALTKDPLYRRLVVETASVHLCAGQVRNETDIGKAGKVAITEPTRSPILREHFLHDACAGVQPVPNPLCPVLLIQI